jgi:putative two-component system response regulator
MTAPTFADARILIVDDHQSNLDLLQAVLTAAGYTNLSTTSDARTVEAMHRSQRFDLILLDIRMPFLDGFQVMAHLAEVHRDDYLPILVLTAQDDPTTRRRALEQGAKDFVTKPFEAADVLLRVRNMLEVRKLYNERQSQNEVLEARVQERTLALEERNRQLVQARIEVIRRLARVGEYRDNETGFHVLRMSRSCYRLALAAGIDTATAERILHASQMHDLGKIGIPDRILLKPGRLDADEMAIMRTHSTIGASVFDDTDDDLLLMARSIALTHHEKWDGSGYPNGLKGTGIPIEGRISAICDVFDALMSERPYKKGWPLDKAVAFMSENAGSHFDPELVARFQDILPEILAIQTEFRDHPAGDGETKASVARA